MTPPSRPSASAAPFPAILTGDPRRSRLLTGPLLRLLLVQFCFGLTFSVYFLLPKYLATELAAGPAAIGLVGACALWAAVLATPLLGRLIDRFGPRRVLLTGVVLSVATSLAMLTVTELGAWLFIVRSVQGVGFALVFNATTAAGAELAPKERLGQAIGLIGTASLTANALAPAVGEVAAERFGWSSVFAGSAALALITALFATRVRDVSRSETEPTSSGGSSRALLYAGLVTGAGFGTLTTFVQPHALALGAERVSGFFVGYTIAAVAIRVAFGGALDRFGRRQVAQLSLAFYAVVVASVAVLEPNALFAFGFAFGIAHGLLFPSLAALVAETSDPARRGSSLSFYNGSFNLGAGLTLTLGGLVARATSYPVLFGVVGVWMLASVLALGPFRSVARRG